ncbi:hypothetical protein [Falsibacillus pallidus]|uniref:Uncharacterized protein n=1 Tax=Falsibacillus pallidus TaxID=493781 RepID=A0A370GWH2_9BACI|nr:hypothetical protein [Falsibacillus pallidus]RDI48018.1 hypothetical protein DFR59_101687 [Falsibacillus pallidus]
MSQESKKKKEELEEKNGSMARDLKEVKELGKQMERHRTNEELQEEGKDPDPIQYDEEE